MAIQYARNGARSVAGYSLRQAFNESHFAKKRTVRAAETCYVAFAVDYLGAVRMRTEIQAVRHSATCAENFER
jgi:hypothetical protein